MDEKVKRFDEFNKLFEYKVIGTPLTDDETSEMDSVSCISTGIPDVSIWVGHNSNYYEPIVKVGNIPNDPAGLDCFTVYLPSLEVSGTINSNFITDELYIKVITFLKSNMGILIDYFNDDIDTDDFYDNITKNNSNDIKNI